MNNIIDLDKTKIKRGIRTIYINAYCERMDSFSARYGNVDLSYTVYDTEKDAMELSISNSDRFIKTFKIEIDI